MKQEKGKKKKIFCFFLKKKKKKGSVLASCLPSEVHYWDFTLGLLGNN